MYSLSGRLNVITFNTLIALTVLSAMNYLSVFLNKGEPRDIKFNLIDFDTFVADKYINEDALSFNFDLQADLEPLFNWNTNIVFLSLSCEYNTSKSDFNKVTFWDQRIPRTDVKNHKLKLSREYPEYYITDVNKNLRNQEVEVYLNWE